VRPAASKARYDRADTRFLVGCSTSGIFWNYTLGHRQNSAESMATVEAACGHQSLHRDYAGTSFRTTSFDVSQRRIDWDSATRTSYRTTHVSWTPDWSLLAANDATEVAYNNAWLDTIPTWHKVILNPNHEADEYQGDQSYGSNYALFRSGFQRLADMIHARNNPNWQVCLLLTAYAWKGNSSSTRDPENFWPGAGYVDVMGVDMYNEGSLTATRWDSPGGALGYPADSADDASIQSVYAGYKYGGFLPWCESKGITKYVVGEVGCQRNIENVAATWPTSPNAIA
jgi:hypothetical protein